MPKGATGSRSAANCLRFAQLGVIWLSPVEPISIFSLYISKLKCKSRPGCLLNLHRPQTWNIPAVFTLINYIPGCMGVWLDVMHKDNLHLRVPAPLGGKADCYTPQLNSKAISLKLDHIIPNDELTHDTKVVGDARRCCNVQQCKCLDANLERDFCLTVSVARATHVHAGEHMVCYFQILSRS